MSHLDELRRHRDELLDFYQPHVCLESGGYAYLDDVGRPLPDQGAQLWLNARMLHCFSIATALGRPGAADVVEHGLAHLHGGAGQDLIHGGWYATAGGSNPSDAKELYGQAHVVLAASSAAMAGFTEGRALLDEALDLIDRRYWREGDGRAVEAYDRTFSRLDPYRGQNANMHLTEALINAYEATGEAVLLQRAVRIAGHIAGRAASPDEGAWRLPEHFDEDWNVVWEFNKDEPRHPFRPYGSQPGHWLEWAKLLLQLRGLGVHEPWLLPAAEHLFAGAFKDAWRGTGGFVYTVDWDGAPVVEERFFWEPAEGMGAARLLELHTDDDRYAEAYGKLWGYVVDHFVDHESGSWFPELDAEQKPVTHTWAGKPDLYHAFQATLYAEVPAHQGLARWASTQASRR
ncbi:AGE family epimerase/isomerase [Tessaracoccus flavus]|uniref:N-acylglucosamine 2-epimerase n=1 Tax=Tessaracoccus flavus TaxID=1610493 RepID=A0A1Q2CHN3_9ACTN|nr:AGE family epimerase/isomerase [Tessaracoccus flavus]AQP45583.1 N-acylglucosamine 2-epimerase [Tessaracoccus flavus]SDY78230.1 sulfoquinovose isomerase [Tessaracoccus flavus]